MSTKQKIGRMAANPLVDFSGVGAIVAYYGLQDQIPSLPDLPRWAVITLMLIAALRGLALLFFKDRDGDGRPDFRLFPGEAAEALADGAKEAAKVKEAAEAEAGSDGPSDPPAAPA